MCWCSVGRLSDDYGRFQCFKWPVGRFHMEVLLVVSLLGFVGESIYNLSRMYSLNN